jgi:hypothetical protein
MLSADDGLVAAVYAPCELRTLVRNTPVHVIEETEYPFRGTIRLTVNPASPLSFPLRLRIPAWAGGATVKVNHTIESSSVAGTFTVVERTWKYGDVVELSFPLPVRASRGFRDSVIVERGPLLFSHGIGEDWLKLRDRGMTADWQVYPTTAWNYALAVSPENAAQSVSVVESPVADGPFTTKSAPVRLRVKARKLPEWVANDGAADPVPQSPVTSDQPDETITLVPYAAAKLRITAFPQLRKL